MINDQKLEIAAMCLQGMLACDGFHGTTKDFAETAYAYAEALLKIHREKTAYEHAKMGWAEKEEK